MIDFTKNDNICRTCLNQVREGGVASEIVDKFNYLLDNASVEEVDTRVDSNINNIDEGVLLSYKRNYHLDGAKVATSNVLVNSETKEVETVHFNMKDVEGTLNFHRDGAAIYIKSYIDEEKEGPKDYIEVISNIRIDDDQLKCVVGEKKYSVDTDTTEVIKEAKTIYSEKPEDIQSFVFSITKEGKSK